MASESECESGASRSFASRRPAIGPPKPRRRASGECRPELADWASKAELHGSCHLTVGCLPWPAGGDVGCKSFLSRHGVRRLGLARAFQGEGRGHMEESVGRRELLVTRPAQAIRALFRSILFLSAASFGAGAEPQRTSLSADPGTVVRWSAPGTKRCFMGKRSWA